MTTPDTMAPSIDRQSASGEVNQRAFTIASIENLRSEAHRLDRNADESDHDYNTRYVQHVDQTINDYLTISGLDDDQRARYRGHLTDVVLTPEQDWRVGPRVYRHDALGQVIRDKDGNEEYDTAPSGIDKLWELQQNMFGSIISEVEPGAIPATATIDRVDRDPALIHAEEKLATLREEMATVSAKRQGKLFGRGRSYEEVKERYDEQLVKVAKLKMGDVDRTQLTDSQLNGLAIGHYLEEQNALRAVSKEKLAGTATGKFINWITEGSKAARLGKGMLVGAGGVIVGAGVGALLGVAAGAALAAGAAATMKVAVSSARGFAVKDNQQGRGMSQLDEATHKLEAQQYFTRHADSAESREDLAHTYFQEVYEKDTQEEQEKRRASARRGIAGAAIGMVVGGTAAYLIGEAVDARPDGKLRFDDWSNRHVDPIPDVSAEDKDVTPVPPFEDPKPEAEAEARENAMPKSDTPDVAESLREGLGGDVNGAPVTGPFSGELGTTTLTPSGLEALTRSLDGYTVKSGDSVWNLAEQHLHAQGIANPSVYQIDAAKDAILPVLQAHGAADANGWLTAGQRISLR